MDKTENKLANKGGGNTRLSAQYAPHRVACQKTSLSSHLSEFLPPSPTLSMEDTMTDPNYNANPPGGYAEDEGICPVCHGILDGFVGIEGEWACLCSDEDKDTYDTTEEQDIDRAIDRMIDAEVDRVRLARRTS